MPGTGPSGFWAGMPKNLRAPFLVAAAVAVLPMYAMIAFFRQAAGATPYLATLASAWMGLVMLTFWIAVRKSYPGWKTGAIIATAFVAVSALSAVAQALTAPGWVTLGLLLLLLGTVVATATYQRSSAGDEATAAPHLPNRTHGTSRPSTPAGHSETLTATQAAALRRADETAEADARRKRRLRVLGPLAATLVVLVFVGQSIVSSAGGWGAFLAGPEPGRSGTGTHVWIDLDTHDARVDLAADPTAIVPLVADPTSGTTEPWQLPTNATSLAITLDRADGRVIHVESQEGSQWHALRLTGSNESWEVRDEALRGAVVRVTVEADPATQARAVTVTMVARQEGIVWCHEVEDRPVTCDDAVPV